MTTILKTQEEIEILREGGRRLANVIKAVSSEVRPGITTKELDKIAEDLIRAGGDVPAFLNYTPEGSHIPYPATLCISVNNEAVHGIPGETKLKDGDIVGLDLGLKHKGFFTDMAITVGVGEISENAKKLIETTKKALYIGIEQIRDGGRIGDIGAAIERFVAPTGFGIAKILGGHGIGKAIHEDPHIPNFGKKGSGPKLESGLLIAIEPIINEGTGKVVLDERDGYTYKTADKKLSAHFEHTVLITDKGCEILTESK